jgi:hypothetical protein
MVCFHKRYDLGDKHEMKADDFEGWEDLKSYLIKNENAKVILPLYLYDHSGITMSTKPFSCNWDSGQVGFIYCTESDMGLSFYGVDEERAQVLMEGEVETYDKYLCGEVYGFQVFEVSECNLGHEHKELIESCYGFYSEEDAEHEALSLVNYYKQQDLKVAI